MINLKSGTVKKIIEENDGAVEAEVDIDGALSAAVNYDDLTGPVSVGDRVVVNTTGVELALGSGGRHFVLWNLSRGEFRNPGPGHLMKLRYTPLQRAALSVEEPDSPHHAALKDSRSIDGLPVIACGLHSQLLPVAATLKASYSEARVAYIMTDGGALPAQYSRTVRWLRENGYLAAVISAGQAFGGDYEAVNLYSALAAATVAAEADIAVVAMGPGIAGTGTLLGHTGMEQGQIINAAHSLGGRPVAVLRISQADPRRRHLGVSHHTITALTLAALAPAVVPVPEMAEDPAGIRRLVEEQLREGGIGERHDVRPVKNGITLRVLKEIEGRGGPKASTMGRGPSEEPAFFLAAGAAAIVAVEMMQDSRNRMQDDDKAAEERSDGG